MQTFLPSPDFAQSAKWLDRMRLGKQRVETWQIIQALTVPGYGWKNHPATKMWQGHVPALAEYGTAICEEWRSRGYKDTLLPKFQALTNHDGTRPHWIGDERVHSSHRSRLLEKLPDWYSRWNWNESPGQTYFWPTSGGK